jgi:hypothetical protein
MQLEILDNIISEVNFCKINYSFACSYGFKEKFNNIKEYKGYPIYYYIFIKEGVICFLPDPTTNNKYLLKYFN